ncbi:MAG: D-2-hydroxyacid dehydrogenase [Acidobacteria bacterium]|nr:D-2-hydroxyacid dehydrogenase [Acidobacteriota bacterium]MBI3281873.1 D-2-hydroxyacid dehydrogenase [Acidobacteriota bacterium]
MKALLLLLTCTLLAPAQNRKIVVFGMAPDAIKDLASASSEVALIAGDQENGPRQVADADAIFGTISPELFRAAKKLKWVQIYSAGVERYRFPEFINSNVTLTNCKIIQGPEIADHALALLLGLTRNLDNIIPEMKTGEWSKGRHRLIELNGKTAVVVGFGGIGSQIGQRAKAFGMRVIAVDPKDLSFGPQFDRAVKPDRLDTVLPEADVVFVSAPQTPETTAMFDERRFGLMKKGAYFVIVSRGPIYNTDALMKALDSKHLSGAGLDVTNPEPLPKDHPLWRMENVIITPHVATVSDRVQERRMSLLKENIERFAKGEALINVVDKQKGY